MPGWLAGCESERHTDCDPDFCFPKKSYTSTMGLITYLTPFILFHFGAYAFISDDKLACYTDLGCFSSGPPFKSSSRPVSLLPASPDSIRTMFILYTRDNRQQGQQLDARQVEYVNSTWTHFKNRTTKFIVHGFLDDINLVSWLGDMKDELLKHGDYNTIIVDWHHGNLFPYTKATANTRVVGAQIALLIKQLQYVFGVDPGQFHVIGHSLGSHIAGYAGERIQGLGRISGLDPAGPYFAGTDKTVRLDPTDAVLVDTIHSDADIILKLGFGMKSAIGDMDFYPNLGHDQPGCEKTPWNLLSVLTKHGISESVACNHLRSIKLFTESINSRCPFMAFACASEADFKANRCHCCSQKNCAYMGFKADKNIPAEGKHVKYYTTTGKDAPYCQYHLNVKVRLSHSSQETHERGTMKIRVKGEFGLSEWIELDKEPVAYYQGRIYERAVGVSRDVGTVTSIEFGWHHKSSYSDPYEWNFWGLRKPKLSIREVDIYAEEFDEETDFCAGKLVVENDKPVTIYSKCNRN